MDKEAIRKQLDAWWGNKSHTKLDWLRFEQFTADVLDSQLDDNQKVRACREALDAFTRRGHFHPDGYLDTVVSTGN